MADIVELTRPDNVELLPGAVQNWHDLGSAAGASGVLRSLVREGLTGVGSCLIAGPHAPELVAEIVDAVGAVTLVVRSIVDAAALGGAHPGVRVLCGDASAALAAAGTFDLVVALDDVTRLHSLEADPASWFELASAVVRCVRPGGRLLFAVENDLGLHRLGAGQNPATRDTDADWTPLATWDATRPRTRAQLVEAVARLGVTGDVAEGFGPSLQNLDVLGRGLDDAEPGTLNLLSALVNRPVFVARSAALAGRLRDHATAWVLVEPVETTRASTSPASGMASTSSASGVVSTSLTSLTNTGLKATAPAASLFTRLAVACTDDDLPEVRRLLTGWKAHVDAQATDGVLPPAHADVRFTNVLTEPWATLRPGTERRPVAEAAWDAVGDFYATARAEGVRLPWPSTLHPTQILEAIVAAGGLEPVADVRPYLRPIPTEDATREDLVAAVQRLQTENEASWNRFLWGENRYTSDRIIRTGKKIASKAMRDGRTMLDRVRHRQTPDAPADGPRP